MEAMRRFASSVVIMLSTSPAWADAKSDVETAIRSAVDGKKEYLGVPQAPWTGVYLLDATGNETEPYGIWHELLTPVPGGWDPKQDYVARIAWIDWKLGAIAIGVDDRRGVAWFQAPVSLEIYTYMVGISCCDITSDTMRASGIAVRDGKAWKLVALALSRQLPDAQLFKAAKDAIETSMDADDPTPPIDKQILATWFAKGGLARSSAAGSAIVASGTAPGEYATGDGATKLAGAWDTIDLRTRSIKSESFGHDAIALVHVDVQLPVKAAHKAVPMSLYAIAIPDRGAWHWVSLQFTTPVARPPKSPAEHVNEPGSPPIPPGVQP
jgi:hypothetical protein